MPARTIPVSAVVPTRDRSEVLGLMLNSLAQQSHQPIEMIVVDASSSTSTEAICQQAVPGLQTRILHEKAISAGAAIQRNQALPHCSQDAILFLDDDIVFQPGCIARLWEALQSDAQIGGANAMIVNQRYQPPGRVSRTLFRILDGKDRPSYAGTCIGPALNLLPEDDERLPEVVFVDWLNTTCTMYRRRALPIPPFDSHFTGYSLMEDLALSLIVGRKWKLANARTAKIFHDSRTGEHKANRYTVARMELINRHFIMTRILGRTSARDYAKLALLETFGVSTSLRSSAAWKSLPRVLLGKLSAVGSIIRHQPVRNGNSATEDSVFRSKPASFKSQ